jgi:hypothetical protein
MRGVTPRTQTLNHIKEAIGKVTYTNLSPTMKARLVSYDIEKSYFEVLPHEQHTKYNNCAGQTFWVPIYMSICFNYREE